MCEIFGCDHCVLLTINMLCHVEVMFIQLLNLLERHYVYLNLCLLRLSSLLLLIKRYNLFEVLACSTTFFHLSLSCATFFQLCTFIFFISSKTSSSHRNLGLPVGLLAMGFHLLIFFTLLSSVMRST